MRKDVHVKKNKKNLNLSNNSRLRKKQEFTEKNEFSMKAKVKYFLSYIIKKQNLVSFFLILVDIILIIYFARRNVVNYVDVFGYDIFLGETKDLFFGRNYIAFIVTFFFYIYTISIQRFFFKKKITKKYLVLMFLFYLILNLVLFYLFTKRVY